MIVDQEVEEFLEHSLLVGRKFVAMNQDEKVEDFLSHYGVKGQKWGVRRAQNREARSERIKSGTATKRDRLTRELDLDGGRTQAIRKKEIPPMSKSEKAGLLFLSGLIAAQGFLTLAAIKMGK